MNLSEFKPKITYRMRLVTPLPIVTFPHHFSTFSIDRGNKNLHVFGRLCLGRKLSFSATCP